MKTKWQLCLALIAIIMLICACEAKVKNGFVKKMMDGHTIMLMTKNK